MSPSGPKKEKHSSLGCSRCHARLKDILPLCSMCCVCSCLEVVGLSKCLGDKPVVSTCVNHPAVAGLHVIHTKAHRRAQEW